MKGGTNARTVVTELGLIRLQTNMLSAKSEQKRPFGAKLSKEAWKMPVV